MARNERPNVVFILTDDQGQWAAGCYGNDEIETPAIDSIANSGVRLDNFFCASPVCSPARASLLTGRIPSQHGVHDWLRDGNTGEHAAEYLAGQTGYTRLLAEAGYTVGLSGKWHMGDSINPQQGHHHWYVHERGGGPYFGAPMIRDRKPYTEERYVTDAITEDACAFIESHGTDEAPFYLGVHYTAPHSPWVDAHPEELLSIYESCSFTSCPDEPFHPWANNGVRWGLEEMAARTGWEQARRAHLQGYYAAVTGMDRGVAQILEAIERHSSRESTIVVFTSDNGMNMGHHGIWGKGNGTLPQNMYDTSVKVPFIVSQPGSICEGESEQAMVSAYDFIPTILELTDVNWHSENLPGKSFAQMLTGRADTRDDDAIVVFDEYGPVRMIRTEQWKYVQRSFYGPDELYDLSADPDEQINLADDSPSTDRLREMRSRLDSWFDRYADPRIDGRGLPVTGMGQLRPVSEDRKAAFEPFPEDRY